MHYFSNRIITCATEVNFPQRTLLRVAQFIHSSRRRNAAVHGPRFSSDLEKQTRP